MELNKILHDIQQKLKAPKNQKNSFGGYNYRSCEDILEAVKPLLPEGVTLTITDNMVAVGNRVYVNAKAVLSHGTAQAFADGWAREAETKKGMDDAQITGSASSYARKYALNGLFCIDDTKDSDATNTHGKEDVKKPVDEKRQQYIKRCGELKEDMQKADNIDTWLEDNAYELGVLKEMYPDLYDIFSGYVKQRRGYYWQI